MTAPAPTPVVLVHGGGQGAWVWEPMQAELRAPSIAVDLPPRSVRGVQRPASIPPELFELTVADFAAAVLAAADRAGYGRFVLAGHSLGGLTIAEVARASPARVAHLVFVSAAVPPEGGSVIDTLPDELREYARTSIEESLATRTTGSMPEAMQRQMFCTDLDDAQARFLLDRCGLEAVAVVLEPVTRRGIPRDVAKTFVRLARDASLPPATQDALVANLRESPGGPVTVVEIDAGHQVMLSRPAELAALIDRIAAAPRPPVVASG